MSKGVSQIISMLMVIIIVVALSVAAYAYSVGLFENTVARSVEFVDVACSEETGSYFLTIRNTDNFGEIITADVLLSIDGVPLEDPIIWDVSVMAPKGGIGIGEISGATSGAHRIKILSPISRPQELVAVC